VKRIAARGGALVLGGGFGGAYTARGLGERGATIVSPGNSLTFSPLLPEAAAATLELRHVQVPLRMMCPHCDVVLGRAVELDAEAREVRVEALDDEDVVVAYDDLVVAVGAVPRTFPIPGLVEHAVGATTVMDAIYLRERVLRQLEAASLETDPERRLAQLTCVFVGGGYAGVETLAELHSFAQDALRYYPSLRSVPQRWLLPLPRTGGDPRPLQGSRSDRGHTDARSPRLVGCPHRASHADPPMAAATPGAR